MSFPRYPAYKDSGVEWLGEVPAHWFVGQAKHVCSFFTGWTPPTGNAAAYIGDNPWANISDLRTKWLHETAKSISDEAIRESDIQVSKAGSLLFSFKLSIGQVSFAGRDLYTNEAIATFPPSGRLSLPFAYYALPFFLVRNASENIYGAKLLNQELMKAAHIVLPGIDEQTAIATFLDRETAKIDALVAEQENLIGLLKEKRQAVISHAVTKGLDPSVPMKDSGVEWLGEVPEHWDVCALRRVIANIQQGWSPDCYAREAEDEEWGVLKAGCVNGGTYRQNENKALPPELTPDPANEVHVGDVLMSRASGSPELVGSTALVAATRERLMLSDKIFRLLLAPTIEAPFFVWALNSRALRSQIENTLSGGNGLANNLPQASLLAFMLAVPPLTEQTAVAAFLDRETARIDALIAEAQSAIALLQERRTALISAAVTGQIDVRQAMPIA